MINISQSNIDKSHNKTKTDMFKKVNVEGIIFQDGTSIFTDRIQKYTIQKIKYHTTIIFHIPNGSTYLF